MHYSRYHRPSNRISLVIFICILLFLVVTIVIFIYFVRIHKQNNDLNNVSTIKQRVGALYLLPNDEEPALATVTDDSKLASSFAGRVKNGDKILIYQKNQKAIAYRPSINKIVDVQPVQIDSVQSREKSP